MNDQTIKIIAMGSKNTVIYKNNGEILVFGDNLESQLGVDRIINTNKPVLLMVDKDVVDICMGGLHVLMLKQNGELQVFGKNSFGKIFLFCYIFFC